MNDFDSLHDKYLQLYEYTEKLEAENSYLAVKLRECLEQVREVQEYHKELMAEHERLRVFHHVIMNGVDKVTEALK